MSMKRAPLDARNYVDFPTVDVARTVAFGIELTQRVPRSSAKGDADEMARIRTAAKGMRDGLVALREGWLARSLTQPTLVRPLDIDFDAAAAAVLARLTPWAVFASVGDDRAQKAARAAEIIALIFPNRLDFTRLELKSEWAEAQKRFDIIEARKLNEDLDGLAGAIFVARMRETHVSLGRGLGLVGEPVEGDASAVDLLETLRETRAAIGFYLLQLTAAYPTASDDLAKAIVSALSPVDALRTQQKAKASSTDTTDATDATDAEPPIDPATPIPPLPEQ